MFSIMLVDDQPAIQAGLEALIDNTGIARVVATEVDSVSAIATALAVKPDLIMLDVSLGKESGVSVAKQLIAEWPDARILAVSAHADSVYVRGMLNAGARGYMLKDKGPAELSTAISAIMQGRQWIGEGLSPDGKD